MIFWQVACTFMVIITEWKTFSIFRGKETHKLIVFPISSDYWKTLICKANDWFLHDRDLMKELIGF